MLLVRLDFLIVGSALQLLYSRGSLVVRSGWMFLPKPVFLEDFNKMLGPRGMAACQESKSSVLQKKQTHEQQL